MFPSCDIQHSPRFTASQFPDIATQTKTPAMLVLTGVCDGKLF